MKRIIFFIYGVACHLLFLATFAYMAAWVGGFLLPCTINTPSNDSTSTALTINLLLLGLFSVQHSVMARPAFKRVWTRIIPEPIERSTYVLISCIVTIVLIWQWRGLDTVVWDAQSPVLRGALWGLFAFGWLMVPVVSLLIDHFDLFGTRQVWFYLKGREYKSLPFRVPALYKNVRHPLYLGWATAFWAIPTMTQGHLLFAGVMTGYMIVAACIEERDLVAHFGTVYQDYRRSVPMFVPRPWASSKASPKTLTSEETTHV